MEKKLNKNKVLLGLSGGVDSTAAALLLQEKGYSVSGYYFDVTGNNTEGRKEAETLARQLGIGLICEDVSSEFDAKIISDFCRGYCSGRTPNPCVICNPLVKFVKLLETADRTGAYYIATGHYSRLTKDEKSGLYYITRAANLKKDQSYMLYRLGQKVLSRLLLPLGDFESKDDIRMLVGQKGLHNAGKKDSQEICFLADGQDHAGFIRAKGYTSPQGNFVDQSGRVLGRHEGIINYTVGQRKGLGIALGAPVYVTAINSEKNEVVLGKNEDLFTKKVLCKDCFFTFAKPQDLDGKRVTAKIRYLAQPASATLHLAGDMAYVIFDEAQRAPAAGQSLVIYDGEKVLGGGFIV